MSERKFSIISRFNQCWLNLAQKKFFNRQSITSWLGWLLSLILLALVLSISDHSYWQIFLFIHFYFLFRLVRDIHETIPLPIEFLLIVFQLLFFIIKAILSISYDHSINRQESGFVFTLIQIILLGVLVLLCSAVLVENSAGKRRSILWFAFLGYAGHHVLIGGNEYLVFFLQAIIFISLLQKTKWLEALTKIECWVYLIFAFLFFRFVVNFNPFATYSPQNFVRVSVWYTTPYVLYFCFKFYLLAVMVKIPVVLIYNHASLSRKLKISGLFQSTFPQFIQLFILILIFFFFVSGWQSQNLRQSIQSQLAKIETGHAELSVQYDKILLRKNIMSSEELGPYGPLSFLEGLPERGILELKQVEAMSQQPGYYIFSKSFKADSEYIYFARIDTNFMRVVSQNLRSLVGNSLIFYPTIPGRLASYIYKMDFIYQNDRYIQIFPFTIFPAKEKPVLSYQFESLPTDSSRIKLKGALKILGRQQLTFGRVYLPLRSAEKTLDCYLAFDILLILKPELLWSSLSRIILILILIYILFNSFIIKQVVRFGSQINETIIQKFNQLKHGIQQIAAGNLEYKIKLEGEDEFVELANHFNQMGDRLKQTIAEARERDLFEYELQLAREVQLSLLPQYLPEIPDFQIAASMRTANTVGGDFYDIFPLDKNRYLFSIGDVSGKGSSAALYMAQCMSLVRFSRQFTTDPGEISSRLNSYFAASITDRQIFVTAIIGILDTNVNTLGFIRAGHTEPIFIPGDMEKEIQVLESKGIGIGLTRSSRMFEKTIKSFKMNLKPGDILVFYTDGVIEAARPIVDSETNELELYGEDRLQNLMKKIREKQAREILETIEQDVDSFYAGNPRVDDHTLLVIQRNR